ncbi:protein transporter, putative [Ricinus communis]|uniref:Protein transporter, putative n=1 Tax=Ricinus communis TaxID=3988 RepID=B9T1B0_RICCO|nr:protein transporter, putative [Ricinus communis]|eukprot:XP_002532031.1 TOM1-like protein 2 [Ricinus communis]
MDKLKISQWGERLKTGGAQMSRMVSDKVKEMLQTPTPESRIVDEATSEMLEEPNWGMNLRICAMINSEEFSGTEIVRAIKRKISGKNSVSQRLSLDLLETCSMNCEKVFSEVAVEKVLDEMVKMIANPQADQGNRDRALQLIRAWGQSEDLEYLPVFRQTYMSLQGRNLPPPGEAGDSPPMQYTLESYIHQQPLSHPERYPIPQTEFDVQNHTTSRFNSGSLSVEGKNEYLATIRNSLELLSSILNSDTEPKPIKEDLTVSLLENCKQSQPVIQRIIQSTTDDEAVLFEALAINDELQQVISQYEKLEAGLKSGEKLPESSDNTKELEAGLKCEEQLPESSEDTEEDNLPVQAGHNKNETKTADPQKESSNEPSSSSS